MYAQSIITPANTTSYDTNKAKVMSHTLQTVLQSNCRYCVAVCWLQGKGSEFWRQNLYVLWKRLMFRIKYLESLFHKLLLQKWHKAINELNVDLSSFNGSCFDTN